MTASHKLILVTGATGRLGCRVVSRLLAEGHAVRILTRRPFAAVGAFADAVEVVEWHPVSQPISATALDDVEAIVHLAGEPFAGEATADRQQRMRQSRLAIADRLAAVVRHRDIRLVVASVVLPPLGASSGDVMTDQTPRAPPSTDFERDCFDVEAACNAITVGAAGVAVVRLGLLLDTGPVLAMLANLAAQGRIPDLMGCTIPVIDPEDAAALITGLVLHTGFSGPMIGVAPEPLKGESLAAGLAAFKRWPLPVPLSNRAAERRLGPLSRLVFNRTRVVPQRLLDAGASFQHADVEVSLSRALAALTDQRAELALDTPPLLYRLKSLAHR